MKESLLTEVFWHAGLFLALSALIIPLMRALKIPSALGYLLAGIAVGPYGLVALTDHSIILDLISLQDADHVKILAELGIVLLLFVIGLELTPRRLWQMRNLVFGLGGAQVLISALIIGGIAFLWGNTVQVAILLGLSLALSSTAIIIQWLHEKKLFVTPVGRTSFSILLLQDLAVIPILLLLTILSAETNEGIVQFAAISLTKMFATIICIYTVGHVALKPLFLFANRYGGSEVFMALSLFVIVLSASVAAWAGVSMALGAFIAGLLLADTEYRHEIASLVTPFKGMLLGIFFFSFGMGIDLSFISEKPFWLFSSVLGLITLKAIIIFILCKLWKQTTAISLENAILLAQAGEFGLLVVGGALSAGLMEENVAQFMLLNIGITMLLAPIMAPLARKVGTYAEQRSLSNQSTNQKTPEPKENHIVIFGFGRVGNAVANALSKEGFEILGFDKNLEKVHHARTKLCPVFVGDAGKKATLDAAQLNQATCIVITIDDAATTKRIAKQIRQQCAHTPIVVRAHSIDDIVFYKELQNIDVIAEEMILSEHLSDTVLIQVGIGTEKQA